MSDEQTARRSPYVVIAPDEIDVATAPVLAQQLTQAMLSHAQVHLDCACVRFCDSSALQVLIDARTTAQRLAVEFHVLHPPRGLTSIAAVLGLSHLLKTLPGTTGRVSSAGTS